MLFIFFSTFILLLLQSVISYRIHGKTLTGHDNLEQFSAVKADLVFLGSSRCRAHFDPLFFDTTYKLKSVNIGVDGHSEISMAIIRLKDYLSRNTTPKFALLSFDPFVTSGDLKNNVNFVHKNDFARYAFLPDKKDLPLVNYFKFNYTEKYVPLYALIKYAIIQDAIFLNNEKKWVKYGYDVHPENWDTVAYPITKTMRDFFSKEKDRFTIISSLDSLKSLCILNSIKLICVQTPVYKIIYDDSNFLEPQKICKELNIPFFDLNKENIRDEMNYFYNSNHLNLLGVHRMNNTLKSDTSFTNLLIL